MLLIIDPLTYIIYIPKAELTLIQTTPIEIRELNLNDFRLTLKDFEDSEEGIYLTKTHNHNTEISLGGLTYARVIEILDPYSITFEDGTYAVNLVGANSNVGDKVNLNQVSVRSNNSAGLISIPTVEYSSFQGGVIIDVNSGISGTLFPRGTEQMPVNNLSDALLIAEFRGFTKIYLHSNINIDDEYDLIDFFIVGQSHIETNVNIEDIALVEGVTFSEVIISGILDGNNSINNCVVGDIQFFNGHIHNSSLIGDIELSGGVDAYLGNCSTGLMTEYPTINMGGSGQNLVMTNYNGIITITNMSASTTQVGIGLSAGNVILDSNTVTSGFVHVSGIGELNDENGNRILSGKWNGNVTIVNNLINRDTISEATQLSSGVYIDMINGISGSTFPIGSARTPVNNIDDAVIIAENLGTQNLYFLSDFTIDSGVHINDYSLIGEGSTETTLTFEAGCIVTNCSIKTAIATGNLSGVIEFNKAKISNLGSIGLIPSSQEIIMVNCLIDGTIILPSNYSGKITAIDCYSNIPGNNTPIIDFGNCTAELQVRNYTGGLELRNIDSGNTISVDLVSGNLKLHDSVTFATITARGVGKMVESSTGKYIPTGIWNGNVDVSNDIMSKGTISEAVWDEPIANHIIAGSAGKVISNLQFNGYVTIDPTSSNIGTTFPVGTERFPVNNLDDAKLIAVNNGFSTLNIISTLVVTSGQSINGYTLSSNNYTSVNIEQGAFTYYSNFRNINLSGYLNGYTIIDKCTIDDTGINEFYGLMQDTIFNGSIKLSSDSTKDAVIIDLISGSIAGPSIIDFNGDGCKLSLRGMTGAILFQNKTGSTKPAFIDIYSGRIGFDSSITAGNFIVRGVGNIYLDDSSNTTFDLEGLMSQPTVANAVWDEDLSDHVIAGSTGRILSLTAFSGRVWLDPTSSYSGTTFPTGTQAQPVNNGPDALLIALREKINEFVIQGNFTTTTDLNDYTIGGDTWLNDGLTFNNNNYEKITFRELRLDGVASFTDCEFKNCYVENIENISGELITCRISNDITVASGKTLSGVEIVVEGDNTVINLQNQPCTVSLDVNSGIITFINAVDGCLIELNLRGGEIALDASCTGGEFYAEGIGTLYNDSAMTILENHLLALEPIADYVWNKTLP